MEWTGWERKTSTGTLIWERGASILAWAPLWAWENWNIWGLLFFLCVVCVVSLNGSQIKVCHVCSCISCLFYSKKSSIFCFCAVFIWSLCAFSLDYALPIQNLSCLSSLEGKQEFKAMSNSVHAVRCASILSYGLLYLSHCVYFVWMCVFIVIVKMCVESFDVKF